MQLVFFPKVGLSKAQPIHMMVSYFRTPTDGIPNTASAVADLAGHVVW